MEASKIEVYRFFLNLIIAITFIVVLVSFFTSMFGIIDFLVRSEDIDWFSIYSGYGILSSLPTSISFLIISFSLLFALSLKERSLSREYSLENEKTSSWTNAANALILLLYFAGGAITFISIGIILSKFIGGDLSLNAFLKFLTSFIVGLFVTFYYKNLSAGIRNKDFKETNTAFKVILIAIVFITSSVGIYILDPIQRQSIEKTVDTLESVNQASISINSYYDENKKLPKDLETVIKGNHGYYINRFITKDITYNVINKKEYTLCGKIYSLNIGQDVEGYPYETLEITKKGDNCFNFNVE